MVVLLLLVLLYHYFRTDIHMTLSQEHFSRHAITPTKYRGQTCLATMHWTIIILRHSSHEQVLRLTTNDLDFHYGVSYDFASQQAIWTVHLHFHLETPIIAAHCSHDSPSSFVSPLTSTFTGSAARMTQIMRTQSPVRFASLP